jgi:tyrosyl-tRNA synthetase
MQAYDSVAIKADIELGGTEQRFNILMGRGLQKDYGQESQVALFMPILEGTDGIEKMSKSLGNYIGINEPPQTMYGKVMSIPDDLMIKYYELATDIHPDALDKIKADLCSGHVNPRDIKMNLAKEIVRLYYSNTMADAAEDHFKTVFQQKGVPEDLPPIMVSSADLENGWMDIIELILKTGFALSKSEARRLLLQGAVRVNGEKLIGLGKVHLTDGAVLKVGKLKMAKLSIR